MFQCDPTETGTHNCCFFCVYFSASFLDTKCAGSYWVVVGAKPVPLASPLLGLMASLTQAAKQANAGQSKAADNFS